MLLLTKSSSPKQVKSQMAKEAKCTACDGKGKKGRWKCKACKGTGEVAVDFFNGFARGFAEGQREGRMNRARAIADEGPQTGTQVSREFDPWYAVGYEFGLDSEDAVATVWDKFIEA